MAETEPGSGAEATQPADLLRLLAAGDFDALERASNDLLARSPDHPDALHGLAVVALRRGDAARCLALLRRAIAQRPNAAVFFRTRGLALRAAGRTDEAIDAHRRALELAPGDAAAQDELGHFLRHAGRIGEALAAHRRAAALDPGLARAHFGIGLALEEQDDVEGAAEAFARALEIDPGFLPAEVQRSGVLVDCGRFDDVVASCQRALALDPDCIQAHHNLGRAMKGLGRLDEAEACYQRALALDPEFPPTRTNRGHLLLLRGDFAQGFAEYEWRWRLPGFAERHYRCASPRWDGAPLAGRSILLLAEQGLGDTMQFVRYARLVQDRGARVLLAVPPALARLFATVPGVDVLLGRTTHLPGTDVHAPLLSLPHVFGTTLATIPSPAGVLRAEDASRETWRGRLASIPGPRVGLAWQGRQNFPGDRFRSVSLRTLAPLLDAAGARFVSLQKGPGEAQIAACGLGARLANPMRHAGDFADTAAIVANLDLVISVDTSVAHLAATLGVPTWILVPSAPDWRWLLGRDDSPWYPSVRLFRQETPEDWDGVVARVAAALPGFLTSAGSHAR